MYRILPASRTQLELAREHELVAAELVVHRQGARAPAEDRAPLARDPLIVVGPRARRRRGVEEELVAVRERDVDDGGLGGGLSEACAEHAPECPGGLGGKAREGTARLFRDDLGELLNGLVHKGYL